MRLFAAPTWSELSNWILGVCLFVSASVGFSILPQNGYNLARVNAHMSLARQRTRLKHTDVHIQPVPKCLVAGTTYVASD